MRRDLKRSKTDFISITGKVNLHLLRSQIRKPVVLVWWLLIMTGMAIWIFL